MSNLLTGKMIMEQRLNDLEQSISKELALQKKYENKLRLTDDPRTEERYIEEIKRQKKVVAKYKKEHNNLLIELNNSRSYQFNVHKEIMLEKELKNLEENISQAQNLLKQCRDAFLVTRDPIDRAKYKNDVDRIKEDLNQFYQEHQELTKKIQQHSRYFSLKKQQQFSDQLKRITIKLDDLSIQLPSIHDENSFRKNETLQGDYRKLRYFLEQKQWQEADQETMKMILKINKKIIQQRLKKEDIENISCKDLQVINTLWLNNSEDQFGFTVQQKVWEEVGGNPGKFNDKIFSLFSDDVGWRRNGKWLLNYNELNFTSNAAKGHFPTLRVANNKPDKLPDLKDNFRYLLNRIQSCLSN